MHKEERVKLASIIASSELLNDAISNAGVDAVVEDIAGKVDEYMADKIAVIWTISDVFQVVETLTRPAGMTFTEEQEAERLALISENNVEEAKDLLDYVLDNHDANDGINWDVLEREVHERKWMRPEYNDSEERTEE